MAILCFLYKIKPATAKPEKPTTDTTTATGTTHLRDFDSHSGLN